MDKAQFITNWIFFGTGSFVNFHLYMAWQDGPLAGLHLLASVLLLFLFLTGTLADSD